MTSRQIRSIRVSERAAGGVTLLYAAAVVLAIVTRTSLDIDGADFQETLRQVGEQRWLFVINVAADFASAVLLVGLAAGLYLAFRGSGRDLALAGSFLWLAAALAWVTASSAGFAVASLSRDFGESSGISAEALASAAHGIALLKTFAGKAGFTLAALGTLQYGCLLAWTGVLPRWLGWLGIVAGLLMLLIWHDGAGTLHRIGGTGYLAWLLLTGCWLIIRGIPRGRPGPSPPGMNGQTLGLK